jgi:hypothetical protein
MFAACKQTDPRHHPRQRETVPSTLRQPADSLLGGRGEVRTKVAPWSATPNSV